MAALPAVHHGEINAGESSDLGLLHVSPETQTDGLHVLLASSLIWILGWILAFYVVRWAQVLWIHKIPRSLKREYENDPNWLARSVLGIIHAAFIAIISILCFFSLVGAPDEVKFAASSHLGHCRLNIGETGHEWNATGQAVALAGLAFTTFTIADVILSLRYKILTKDHCLHHAAYIFVGMMLRANCMLPYNASILLSMEVSTPFLNYCVLMLKEGTPQSCLTTFCGSVFVFTFLTMRILLNTYGALYLLLNYDIAMPLWVPTWELWLLILAVVAGVVVQFIWLPAVLRKFMSAFPCLSLKEVPLHCRCGEVLFKDAPFCGKCGAPRPNACACGHIMLDDASTCRKCGLACKEAVAVARVALAGARASTPEEETHRELQPKATAAPLVSEPGCLQGACSLS